MLRINRRIFLATGLAAPALITHGAHALPSAPAEQQNGGWYRFMLGSFEITVLSDGNLVTSTDVVGADQPRDEVTTYLTEHFMDPVSNYAHTNHIMIDTGAAKLLVDVGSGDKFQPSAGRLLDNLEAAGVDPASITHVALTHAHPDHVWGMMDDFGDEARIPEAEYAIGAAEFDWWMAPDRINQVPEPMQAFVVGAQNALTPVAEQTAMRTDGDEIVPGVRYHATHGHTPGHMSLIVESDGEAMLVTGDAINHPYASFEHPEWHFGFDTDKEMAVATRKRLLDMVAADRMTIASYHLPFPGIGHAQRVGEAYRYIPSTWIWNQD